MVEEQHPFFNLVHLVFERTINIHVSQEKSQTRGLHTCYLKVMEGQVSLLTLFGRPKIYINSSIFGYYDGHKTMLKEF